MQNLRLRLFGGFDLEYTNGETVTIPLRKGTALLGYLAAAVGKSTSREMLAALLWGESDQQRARQSLRQALFALTREFAQNEIPVLRLESQMVSLNPEAVWIDAGEFDRLIAEGSPDALVEATALYGGEFLAGLIVDAPDFEDWLAEARGRYRGLAMKAFESLLAHQEAVADVGAAIETAGRALRIDSFREDLHRRLMELYLAKGMRSSALTQYRACRAVLERELGVPPDEETEALYRRILEQGPPCSAERLSPEEEPVGPPEDGREFTAPEGLSVGRSHEQRALTQHVEDVAGGASRFVAIVGEAGVGKSHLIETFAGDLAARGVAAFVVRAHRAERSLSFGLWADLLNSESLDGGRSGAPHETARPARPIPRADGEESVAQGSSAATDRRGFYDEVVGFLRERAAQGPVVVVLDDLQWADEESLRLAYFLVRHLDRVPVLFVGTVRAEEMDQQNLLSDVFRDLEQDGRLALISLQPLSREQTAELVQGLQGAVGDNVETKVRLADIWALSEGNPQIIVETLRAAVAQGRTGRSGRAQLPDRVRKDLSRLLMPLGESARKLAVLASVMGPRVDYAVLRQAANLGGDEIVRGVEELVSAQVLKAVGEDLVFARKRVQRALYEDLLPPRRKALHTTVARAIGAVHAEKLEAQYQTLAHHHREARNMIRALECEAAAGLAELNRGARGPARKLFQRVLKSAKALTGDEKAQALEVDAHLGLAAIAEIEEDLNTARECLEAVESRFDRIEIGQQRAATLIALSRISHMHADENRAYYYARGALTESRRGGGESVWLPAERLLARIHLMNGNYGPTADRLARRLERTGALDLREDEADAAASLGLLHALRGDFERAVEHGRRAVRTAESLANERCLAACLQFLGMSQAWRGDFRGALDTFDKAGDIAQARGDLLRLYSLHGHRGFALSGAERPDEALQELATAEAMAKRLNTTFFLPLFKAWMGEALLQAQKDEEALHLAREAFQQAAELNQPWARSVALRVLARVLTQPEVRDFTGAEKAIRSALGDQDGLGLKFEMARSLVVHAKVLRAAGNMRRSSDVYAEASEMFREMQMSGDFDTTRNMAEALKPTGDSRT